MALHLPSSLKVAAGGDSQYRRSPDFLWRFARGIYLVCAESQSEENTFVTVNDLDIQNSSTSVSSRTFIPNDLNDLAYDRTNRRQFIETGLALARKCLVLAKMCHEQPDYSFETRSMAEVYKWLAVMVGLASEFVGMQQRISYGYEFKELVDKALEHNPEDEHCRYLKGRWCYQVYNLTWVERQFASRLFATLPTATLEEAMEDFNEVERLRPDFYAANHLYLAKCHISAGNYKEAASWLSRAKQLVEQHRVPPPHLDNLEVCTEIIKLADQYSTYC
ncbi:unnamed protein product [Dicrocoelium dendriticum]|nr:unnamed protein product [Dicrocoelium dendriticum]